VCVTGRKQSDVVATTAVVLAVDESAQPGGPGPDRHPCMLLSELLHPAPRRKFAVSADALTVIGSLHTADGVPNQDASFTMTWPGVGLASRKRQGRSPGATTDGIYGIGVFDGHGDAGHTASRMACQLAKETLNRLFTSDYRDGRVEHYVRLTFEILSNALDAHPCSEDSGTTATIAIVHDSEVVIGHCGDSCGLLISSGSAGARGTARYVTPMHRTAYETERARIDRAGGLVMEGYVVDKETKNKGISVTRTLGDRDMHKNGCISIPEIQVLKLLPTDRAISVATDGLWDCEGVVVRDVLEAVRQGAKDPAAVNQLLMNLTTPSGPSDDCTIATMVLR
jgi:serine/threonine protein phosphatase PrpC